MSGDAVGTPGPEAGSKSVGSIPVQGSRLMESMGLEKKDPYMETKYHFDCAKVQPPLLVPRA